MRSPLEALRRRRSGGRRAAPAPDGATADPPDALPDFARPPENRGEWGRAALTNVDITEAVKAQIGTRTRPWEK